MPGYIRFWDGSRWVPGTSKPMPDGAGEPEAAAGDASEPSTPSTPSEPSRPALSQAPAFSAPPVLTDVNFDDLLPPEPDFETESQGPSFPSPRGMSDGPFDDRPAEQQQSPAFPVPPSMSEMSFDAPQPPPAPAAAPSPPPGFPASPVAGASGMGISISGPGAPHPASGPTPAQVAATSQSLRIRLLRPDGKPFDGPEITTGPKEADTPGAAARTGFDSAQRGPKKQAPKVVVKTGPLERVGHTLAVLAISAIGIVPLAFLLLQSVHDREDELAAKITVPTKMNVLDGTSDAYLAGMAVVLLVVAFLYWTRLKRRRTR